jgi:hypothetical protein
MKRERRAVQNAVDIDRVVGSGGVSESETIIRLGGRADADCRIPRSRLLGLCRPRKHTSHAPTSRCLRLSPSWYLYTCYIMRDPRGKTRVRSRCFHSNSTQHESHANEARFRCCKGPNFGNYNLMLQNVGCDVRSRRRSWHCLAPFAASRRRSPGP